jgi:THO complex subunit 2
VGNTRLIGLDNKRRRQDEMFDFKEQRDKAFWERVGEVGMSAFFEIGARRVTHVRLKGSVLKESNEDSVEVDQDRKWIEATRTLPPKGNRVAAQLLGFKLRFYASPARELNDILPVNLISLAALLIKIGFISSATSTHTFGRLTKRWKRSRKRR